MSLTFDEKIRSVGHQNPKGTRNFTKLNYCQYLLSNQINYTLTNLANHLEQISHDKINRHLKNEQLTPRLLLDNAKKIIEINDNAYLVFDDTVTEVVQKVCKVRWKVENFHR